MKLEKKTKVLIWVTVVMLLSDFLTTVYAVSVGGMERNEIIVFLMSQGGLWWSSLWFILVLSLVLMVSQFVKGKMEIEYRAVLFVYCFELFVVSLGNLLVGYA